VDVLAGVGADDEAATVVQPGEGAFDDPAVMPESGAVFGLAAGADRLDAALPDEAAGLVVVVASIGDQRWWSTSWPSDPAAHGWHAVEQSKQLSDVVRLPPVSVQASGIPPPSTSRWCLLPRRPRSTGLGPVLASLFSPAGGWSRRPRAPIRADRRRQAVIPQPKPSSGGRCSQPIPVWSTNKMPCKTLR